MHTQTHRHFVAIPVAIVAALLVVATHTSVSAFAGLDPGRQTVLVTTKESAVDVRVTPNVAVHLEPGSAAESFRDGKHIELRRGHMLLKTSDMLVLDAGNGIMVFAVDASFSALRDDSSTTVAALVSPIIVSDDGELHLLAPGMQYLWRGEVGERLDLPFDWYGEHVAKAALLDLPETENTIRSPIAGGRITDESLETLFADVAAADTDGTLRRALLIRLLAEGSRTDEAAGARIAHELNDDPWFGSSLGLVLPRMVIAAGTPAAGEIVHAWAGWIIQAGLRDATPTLEALETASQIPLTMNARGYPEQALHWQKAVSHAGAVLRSTKSPENQAMIDDILTRAARSVPEIRREEAEYVPPAPLTHWSAEELQFQIRELIVSRGGLLATTTEFAPDAARQTVRVTGVFVAEEGRDIGYAFTYDASAGLLMDIVRDGKKLPNALSPETLFP